MRAFRIVVLDIVFESSARIELDQVTIEHGHMESVHAEDSIIVRVPEARIIFLGDYDYQSPLRLRSGNPLPGVAMLRSLEYADYWGIKVHFPIKVYQSNFA